MFRLSSTAAFYLASFGFLLSGIQPDHEESLRGNLLRQGFRSAFLMRGHHDDEVPRLSLEASLRGKFTSVLM